MLPLIAKCANDYTMPHAQDPVVFLIFFFIQEVPKCGPLQNQIDSEQPFNPDFVTHQFQSYLTTTYGKFENKSLVMTSYLNLTCFYPGKAKTHCLK